jgi:hypothetical protein
MSDKVKIALEAVMILSDEERAEFSEILETFEAGTGQSNQAAIDAAWGEEADRRYQTYKRGEIKSVPVEEVRAMLKRRMSP